MTPSPPAFPPGSSQSSEPAALASSSGVSLGRILDATLNAARRRVRWPRRRTFIAAGLSVVGLVTLSAPVALVLSRAAPAWWRTVDPSDPQTVERAEALENGVLYHLQQSRGAGTAPWRAAVQASDANAWLNTRLPKWARNQSIAWPPRVRELQVYFEGGRMLLGVRLGEEGGRDQFLSASVEPRIDAEGSMWLHAHTVSIGRLTLPASWILPGLSQRLGTEAGPRAKADIIPADLATLPETRELLRALNGEIPIARAPIIRLVDGRRVRLLEIVPREARLELSAVTQSARP